MTFGLKVAEPEDRLITLTEITGVGVDVKVSKLDEILGAKNFDLACPFLYTLFHEATQVLKVGISNIERHNLLETDLNPFSNDSLSHHLFCRKLKMKDGSLKRTRTYNCLFYLKFRTRLGGTLSVVLSSTSFPYKSILILQSVTSYTNT